MSDILQDDVLEEIDFDLFNDLTLSISDEEREAVFVRAQQVCLRAPPVESTARTRRGNTAWVVFNGREVGVFGTW
jgi:hypothetical protein